MAGQARISWPPSTTLHHVFWRSQGFVAPLVSSSRKSSHKLKMTYFFKIYIANRLQKASNTTEKRDISMPSNPGSQAKLHYLDHRATTGPDSSNFSALESHHRPSSHSLCPRYSTTNRAKTPRATPSPLGTCFAKASLLLSQDGHKPCALDLAEHEEEGEELHGNPPPSSQGPQARNGLPAVEMEEGSIFARMTPVFCCELCSVWPCPAPALLSQAGPKPEMACQRWKWRRGVFLPE